MQNLVILMEPSEEAYEVSLKGGNMCLNRFSIDVDAAFEVSGVYNLEQSSYVIAYDNTTDMISGRNSKGQG